VISVRNRFSNAWFGLKGKRKILHLKLSIKKALNN